MRDQKTTPSTSQKVVAPFIHLLISTKKLLCARPLCSVLGMRGQPDAVFVLRDAGTCWAPALWLLLGAQACTPTLQCPTSSACLTPPNLPIHEAPRGIHECQEAVAS